MFKHTHTHKFKHTHKHTEDTFKGTHTSSMMTTSMRPNSVSGTAHLSPFPWLACLWRHPSLSPYRLASPPWMEQDPSSPPCSIPNTTKTRSLPESRHHNHLVITSHPITMKQSWLEGWHHNSRFFTEYPTSQWQSLYWGHGIKMTVFTTVMTSQWDGHYLESDITGTWLLLESWLGNGMVLIRHDLTLRKQRGRGVLTGGQDFTGSLYRVPGITKAWCLVRLWHHRDMIFSSVATSQRHDL